MRREKKDSLFFTIALSTYNREKHIKLCLDTLTTLKFPKEKYEIIVVDDGSTDKTVSIVKKYKNVRLLRHKVNRGIAAARNTGLKAARGNVYICFDDDCFVDQDWLKNIEKAYQKIGVENTIGIAGHIELKGKGLIEKYMYETGYGNPSPSYYGQSKNLIKRFVAYLQNMFSAQNVVHEDIYEVGEIWGANCSFPVEVLKGVDGWDESLSGVEDTDLCDRIKKKYTDKKFYCTDEAILYHDHQLSLKDLFLKPYIRAHASLNFYNKNKKTPPIFPFPIWIVTIAAVLSVVNPLIGILLVLALPLICYSWWIIRAFSKRKLYFLAFPYLQAGYELFTILGLLRGFIKNNLYFSPRRVLFLLFLFSLEVNVMVIGNFNAYFAKEIFASIFLLFLPGLFIAWIMRLKFLGTWEFIAYIIGLSVVAVMLIGLIANIAVPPIEQVLFSNPSQSTFMARPLDTLPILFSIDFFLGIFWIFLYVRNKSLEVINVLHNFSWKAFLLGGTSFVLPLFSIIGAIQLNLGGNNLPTLFMLGLTATFVVILTILRDKINEGIYPYILFSMALSLLFMTSLRGWFITGHDIFLEYYIFQLTKAHGIWQMTNFQDPYNACLSITILPTIIANITHIPDLYIYKAIYQIVFASSIVVTYLFIRRLLNPFLAFLASFAIVSLPTFMTDMPMLNRQEIALVFFALILYTLFNRELTTLKRWVLFVFLGIGMLLSHYSTTYIAMGLFIGGYLLYLPLHLEKIHSKVRIATERIYNRLGFISKKQNLRIDAVLVLLVIAILWNTTITNTSKGISTTISKIVVDLQTNNFAKSKSDPAAYGLLNNKKQSPQSLLDDYVTSMTTFVRKFNDNSAFLSKSIYDLYPVSVGSQVILPLTKIGGIMQRFHVNVFSFNDSLKQTYAKVIQLFIIVGFFAVFLLRKYLNNFEKEYYILTITFFIILVFEIVLPGNSIDYGILRLFQQGMILFSVPLIMGGLAFFSIFNFINRGIKYYLLSFTFIFFFLYLSGVIPQITGGYYPQLNVANGGFYYDAYYTHTQDKTAMDWLSTNRNPQTPVQSDWFALKKFHTYEGFYAIEGLTPSVIRKNSYVYLSYSNLETGEIITYINGAPVYYKYDFNLLNNNKNLIYSSGKTRIYR